MTTFDDFIRSARESLAVQRLQDTYAEDLRSKNQLRDLEQYWETFAAGLRRLLPKEVHGYLPPINPILPKGRYQTVTLSLPGCLDIDISVRTLETGQPLMRDTTPFLVTGAIERQGVVELLREIVTGARYQPVWVSSLPIAAAMAEERFQAVYDPNAVELRYEPDLEQAPWEEQPEGLNLLIDQAVKRALSRRGL